MSPSGWLDCDIIHKVHVCLTNINKDVEGLQRPTLGAVRNFNRVNGEYIQILHTPGNAQWVCVGSVGCENGTVNLYDSLYHNIILNEVQEQVLILVGRSNFTGIQVVPEFSAVQSFTRRNVLWNGELGGTGAVLYNSCFQFLPSMWAILMFFSKV